METLTFEQFYAQSLSLAAPWKITGLNILSERKQVVVEVKCPSGLAWGDPLTGERAQIKDWQEREWRHTDSLEYQTIVKCRVPRITLSDGTTTMVSVPWAGPHGRFTRSMEQTIIDYLLQCKTVRGAARLAHVTVDQVDGVVTRAVALGMKRRGELPSIKLLAMDEKAFRSGHRYVTILHDLDSGRVLDIVVGKKEQDVVKLLETLPEATRQDVEAVAMDMWPAYRNAVEQVLPKADVVFDRFHVVKHLNEAVDQTRRNERREQAAVGDTTLVNTKYLWLKKRVDLRTKVGKQFRDLLNQDLNTGTAWSLKQNFQRFWNHTTWSKAFEFLGTWVEAARDSGLPAMLKVADLIDKHAEGLLNYIHHGVTNAISESRNASIQALMSAARGLPNPASLRNRILFFFGKLDLTPA